MRRPVLLTGGEVRTCGRTGEDMCIEAFELILRLNSLELARDTNPSMSLQVAIDFATADLKDHYQKHGCGLHRGFRRG